eukprot:TRINITY_DN1011_c0_g1_i2.p1 TRINITY_DN1011_c0_g1~~TRINITY_DN1011_c0_g1_i2.p1  ORF type:complete len:585 (+),score=108.54 TRINITY_DN1011_c0_g1_i2:117-1871(+)
MSTSSANVLPAILQVTLSALGFSSEKVLELTALAELTQLQLGDVEREEKAHEAMKTIYNVHLKDFLANEAYIKKIIVIQKIVRGYLIRKRLRNTFSKPPPSKLFPVSDSVAGRRLEVFKEFMNSERICLNLLKVIKLYKTELQDDASLCELLFTHTDKMFKLHQRIFEKLLTCCGEKPWEFDFSAVASGLVKLVPKFSIYIDYTKAFKKTINVLDTNTKSNEEFAARLEEIRETKHPKHPLRELFFFPLYRVSQYSSQLQMMSQHFEGTEKVAFQQATSVFYQLAEYLQTSLRVIDNNETLFAIQNRLISKDPRWNLADVPSRQFLREIETKVDGHSRTLFLFSDLLIICRQSKKGDLKMIGDPYKLSLMALRAIEESSLELSFVYNTQVTTIAFPTIEERNEFNDILSLYIDETDNKVFGVPLTEVKDIQDGVPAVILELMRHIERQMIHTSNLFSYQPEDAQLSTIKHIINGGRGIEDSLDRFEPYAVGFALRAYLSDLPEPLLGSEAFDKVTMNPDMAVESIINYIPKTHFDLFEFLMALLWKVLSCSDENGYTVEQLATEFGYVLIRSKEPSVYSAFGNT